MSSKNIFFVFAAVALAATFVNGIFINVLRLFTDHHRRLQNPSISGRNIFGGESEDEAGSFLHLLAAEGLCKF